MTMYRTVPTFRLPLLAVAPLLLAACSMLPTQRQAGEIEAIVRTQMAAGGFPSMVVLIDRGGETLYSGTFGIANLEHGLEPTVDTPYAIGSITKSFTALAVLQLVAAGKVDLDAPVSAYLPEFKGPARKVSVARLLDHTSGMPNYTNLPQLRPRLERDAFTREQMLAEFGSLPLAFPPGDKFDYTNSGYYLLGLIIEAVTGQSYYEALRHSVFEPLGLTATYSGDGAQVIQGRAGGYDQRDGKPVNAPPWHHLVPFSAGSLVSTASDLVRYRRGVFRSPQIPAAVRELVVTTRPMNGGENNMYALGGVVVGEVEGRRKIAHAGDIWGFAANHAYYPDQDVTIVILANRQVQAPAISSIEQKVARVVFGEPQPAIRDLTLPMPVLTGYAGDYDLHPFIFGASRFGFAAQDGRLFIRFGGLDAPGPMIPLLAQGDGVFRASFDDEWLFTFTAQGLVSHYRDGVFTARRAAGATGKK